MGPHLDSRLSRKLRVAVLCGGTSAERVISLKSGAAVSRALAGLGHSVHEVDPALVNLAQFDWTRFDAAFIDMEHTSFDLRDVHKCCIGMLVPDGRTIPFCAYNCAGYREDVTRSLHAHVA